PCPWLAEVVDVDSDRHEFAIKADGNELITNFRFFVDVNNGARTAGPTIKHAIADAEFQFAHGGLACCRSLHERRLFRTWVNRCFLDKPALFWTKLSDNSRNCLCRDQVSRGAKISRRRILC